MNAQGLARDYINIKLKHVGYNCMFIIDNSDDDLRGKTIIFEEDFLKEIEAAFMAGFTAAKENVGEKSCLNCDHYNGIRFYDEAGNVNVSCRMGGLHMGLQCCEDHEDYEEEDFLKENDDGGEII